MTAPTTDPRLAAVDATLASLRAQWRQARVKGEHDRAQVIAGWLDRQLDHRTAIVKEKP